MNTLQFLEQIYKGCDSGYLTIWTRQDKRTAWFNINELEKASQYAVKQSKSKDVYFGLGLRKTKLDDYHRGENADVSVITAFWMDIDIKGDGHKQSDLPNNIDEALDLLNSVEQKPSIVVHSGGGLHAYWLFAEPIIIMTDAHRDNISGVLSGFQECIIKEGKNRGWKLDNTSDLARVLRLPETKNYKIQGAEVFAKVIFSNDIKYIPQDFKEYKSQTDAEKPIESNNDRHDFTGVITGSGDRVFEKCTFFQYCRDNAANLPEPYWHAMITNLSLANDGRDLCHKVSIPYPNYNKAETDVKITRAINEHKPHTCGYMKNKLSFDGCVDCKVKAPISYTIITKEEQVRGILEAEITDYTKVFDKEYVDALSYAKDKMPADYAKFKAMVKGNVNIRDMEACIRANKRTKILAEHNFEPLELDDIDLCGMFKPSGWDISMSTGVKKSVSNGDTVRVVTACPVPVVISKRLRNIDTGNEKIELSFYRDGHWQSFVGSRSSVFNRSAIVSFADTGLPINSGIAADFIGFLSDLESANMNTIPCKKSISRVGWINNTDFYPFTGSEDIEFEPDSTEATVIYKALTKQGDYELWKKSINYHRNNNFARFQIAASFASPLLEKVGSRVFFIHMWYDSKSGKTALLKAALSIWGDPLRLISSFNATQVGLERKAGALDTLPFAIDELQALNEKRVPASSIVYNIGNGFGKLRGAKTGGIQELAEWRTIVLTTGEQPITSDSSMDGVQSRVFELYAKMIEKEEDGTKLHQIVERNFGEAGLNYLIYIADILKKDKNVITKDYDRLYKTIEQSFGVSGYMPVVAIVALGDYYASQAIWQETESVAFTKAVAMAIEVLTNNNSLLREESVQRAYDFACDFIVSNAGKFNSDSVPQYGICDDDGFWVIPQYLHKALEENGFNVTKSIQGFKERGFIPTFKEGAKGKVMTTKRVRMGNNVVRTYRFSMQLADGVARPLKGKNKDE